MIAAQHPRAALAAGLGRARGTTRATWSGCSGIALPVSASLPRRAPLRRPRRRRGRRAIARGEPLRASARTRIGRRLQHLALAGVLALSAVLNVNKLSQNGYANIFYSAGVKSMLRSWHNFVFVSFDPGGLVTVDKPPLALWVQAASAKLFGFSPLSLLLPEAIIGVLAVAAAVLGDRAPLRRLARRVAGALTLAVFPSFVAVSRDERRRPAADPADGPRLRRRAARVRNRALAHAGVVRRARRARLQHEDARRLPRRPRDRARLPRSAPRGRSARRIGSCAVAGLAMLVVSFAWIAFVELTPASKRPYVGSSTNNTELGLTFAYNGFGRVEGQAGGPGHVAVLPGAYVPGRASERAVDAAAARRDHARASPPAPTQAAPPAPHDVPTPTLEPSRHGPGKEPDPLRRPARPAATVRRGPGRSGRLDAAVRVLRAARRWRCWCSWIAGARDSASVLAARADAVEEPARSASRPPRPAARGAARAGRLVPGGGRRAEPLEGHRPPLLRLGARRPAPGRWRARARSRFVGSRAAARRIWGLVLMACAVAATVAAQIVLMHREHYLEWFIPCSSSGAAVGLCALLALRRLAVPAVALTLPAAARRADRLLRHDLACAGRGHVPGRRAQTRRRRRRLRRQTRATSRSTARCPTT